jgi:hypothetical protein
MMHASLRKRRLASVAADCGVLTTAYRCLIAGAVGRPHCPDRRRIWHARVIPMGFHALD